jgi:hypothetical protein
MLMIKSEPVTDESVGTMFRQLYIIKNTKTKKYIFITTTGGVDVVNDEAVATPLLLDQVNYLMNKLKLKKPWRPIRLSNYIR